METKIISDELMEKIISDRIIRREITRQSHLMFFMVYFPHYVKYQLAEFHKDIFRITEDQSNQLACIAAFRGSGKSTLVTFSYSLWSILGIQAKKFVLIICQTQSQAKQHMMNLRHELEQNKLLGADLGPFQEESVEWGAHSIVFSNTNARITIASIDQSIRGIRHHENRPDLIILDDVEDINLTKTLESRNKLFEWFTREIVPLGDLKTRIILIGNLLHEDSLMMRLRIRMEAGELKGIIKWFPLLTDDGECLWPGKFDTKEKIENLRRSVANDLAWQQEYLLKIVSDSSRVIHPEWIQYHNFESLAEIREASGINGGFIGVDLAISQSSTADYTAIVVGVVCRVEGKIRLVIVPKMFNERMTFPETIVRIKKVANSLRFSGCYANPIVGIETNGFQEIYASFLSSSNGLEVKSMKNTTDKRSRIALLAPDIMEGNIIFPKTGAETLIAQLTGLGRERNDDLADALVMLYFAATKTLEDAQSWEISFNNGGPIWVV